MSEWQSAEIGFASGHPTASGHFPGNPIIPGALLLDKALACIAGHGPVMVRNVKFLHIVRPGASLTLRWRKQGGVTKFECHLQDNGALAMTGTLETNP